MKLAELAAARRLAAGLFLLSLVYFYAHAQWNLWVNVGSSAVPTPQEVLEKYHGKREKTRLEVVLDPDRNQKDDLAMYQYLDNDYEGPETQKKRYEDIMAWIKAGAPEDGWPTVKDSFTRPKMCVSCHAPGEEKEMPKAPLTSYEQVKKYAQTDTGMGVGQLAKLSHSHLAGFALLALVTSVIFSFTRYRMGLTAPLFLAVFLGPILDVTGWWLTREHGDPWQWAVIAGGGLFGASLMTMVVLALDELWLGSLLGRLIGAVSRPVGIKVWE